jgi:hypothetical protein
MSFDMARPLVSGLVGGIVAAFFCVLLSRWVPSVCNGKNTEMLARENRIAIWIANALFFLGFVVGIVIYQVGLLPNTVWRGLAVGGGGGGSLLALAILCLLTLVQGRNPKEAYVAFAIAQGTPILLLYGILMLSIAAFAAAVASLLAGPG